MEDNTKNILKKFNHLYRELDNFYHEIAMNSGLSDSAYTILYAMAELGDGCSQTEISKQYSTSVQTIHTSAKNLEKKGYLTFQKGKGREMRLYLTEEGKKIVEEKILPVFELENNIFIEMGQEKSEQLLHLTEKYVELFRRKAAIL